ncbi:error-prone DNA polymerase [Stakelama tenebrarum]|uniref:Error-prone DNA polymerase n=1 Tax=Stakelama tenebrarum TaxID=2711215 RepID=A0A6G6Y3V0_9SPHN|nr:error-prone DNA polymerase [Sphingosinithalassobacter tenebrarum]QIG79398.1 DNA polymerase III subunit alpha [Sphingosinithalassobacter tenebrarum]
MSAPETGYAELAAATNFSFLRGASTPREMVETALALGHAGIGIADRNTVAGVVRAHVALRDLREAAAEQEQTLPDFRLVVGARLAFADGTPDILAYPMTRHGWGRLTRLLTTGNRRAQKGDCILRIEDLLHFHQDLLLIVMPPATRETLQILNAIFANRLWLGAVMPRGGRDARELAAARELATANGLPLIALNDTFYATPEARPLHDILTATRLKTTVQAAGRSLAANAERHLKSPREMARLFAAAPEALAEIPGFLARIAFTLDDLRYEYPHEPVPPGYTPQGWLTELVHTHAAQQWPEGMPPKLAALIDEELGIIGEANYAAYFLTVHDIVRFAQSQGILCQGRGSAANSAVCYVLGITAVDPAEHNLLFSRFISPERKEPPDIDVDFEHERREEVMQYVYKRYGRHRAGIAATVIHYRPRSAVREVGKALGLSEDVTTRLASMVWGSYASQYERERVVEAGLDPDNPEIARVNHFVGAILNFPRHLSQHVGGFVLTQDRLDETVPIHNAAMEDRTFIEWDKDDIDALGLMKVDVLALGMLTCIRKAFELIDGVRRPAQYAPTSVCAEPVEGQTGRGAGKFRGEARPLTLQNIPDHALDVYEMLQKGDSIGVFQVESRAQMNMLPRLRPEEFYDLVIQVAIVRPGPIQGDMVHPYLRRRQGREKVDFPSPNPPHDPNELRALLGKTLGVPLFQEQAMKLAIAAAEFTPSEANQLRRAMATFRNLGSIEVFRDKMVEGMVRRGYERDFAERCFKQIEGFGSYGFPESHAIAFGRLVWVSAYLKCRYPAVFAAALLNSQPMGFYAPAQIVRDAREHGVEVRAIDINHSHWDNSIEDGPKGDALRLGFRQITGFKQDWADAIAATRPNGSIEQLARAAHLPQRALRLLADADALRSIGLDRREGLWEARRTPPDELPLFAASKARELGQEPEAALPAMPLSEQVAADYQTTRLSLKAHPMSFLRPVFEAERVLPCAALAQAKGGMRAKVAGVVLVRQRPGKGNAVFVTLEDEGGICNVVIWARLFERYRRQIMASRLMLVEGEVQKSPEGVIHLMAQRVHDRTGELARLSETHQPQVQLSRADVFQNPQHPRNVRILPRSRDFH